MKKVVKNLFFVLFLLIFWIISQKPTFAATSCSGGVFLRSSGLLTEENTIVFSHTDTNPERRILNGTNYQMQIFSWDNACDKLRIVSTATENNKVEFKLRPATSECWGGTSRGTNPIDTGQHRVILEHADGSNNDICEGNISFSYPTTCNWSVSPANSKKNEPITITVINDLLEYNYKRDLQKTLNSATDTFPESQDKNSFTFAPKDPGTYLLTLRVGIQDYNPVIGDRVKMVNICSATLNIGDLQPGTGISGGGPVPGEEIDKLCQDNVECLNCFNGVGQPPGTWTALGCIPTNDLNQFAKWILGKIIFVASGIAFLLMAFGAFQIITSSGDPKKTQAGSELITSALSGLLFIILSIFLLKLIGVDILRIPGFGS